MSDDNDTARLKARIDAGASVSEIAQEAYRISRINVYLRKAVQNAKDALRKSGELTKKQAVIEDALNEMRDELLETRKLLGRTWGLLEQRNVTRPADMELAYDALRTRDQNDWQAQKKPKHETRVAKKNHGRQQQNKQDKSKGKMKNKKKGDHKVTFLLHTHDGRTYNMRDPPPDNDTNDDAGSFGTEPGEVPGDDGIERPPAQAGPSAYAPTTSVGQPAYTNDDRIDANSTSKANEPKINESSDEDTNTSADLPVATPVVGEMLATDKVAAVNRKKASINEPIGAAIRKRMMDDGLESTLKHATSPVGSSSNKSIKATSPANSGVVSLKRKASPALGPALKKPKLSEELEDGEIDESADTLLEEGEIQG
ncbi:uncharacterized protein K460DRAFT_430528 [Cucurbitaria berberidis CBS 394.84]|uniref:Uncharacterized protein n=1 Tax=Cucurbitaria berberidis CBS 394.84 TaxID=1168544 RepID=A0A9P4L832_9PLEO|nr:uncharacterized protein K460DRAFT_430528 [Cucurbitaria berberidis CBS 394.84]KAF1845616.1 hypothetical protein K460DRAFT_430528 [Cucurbitaria berberidis CBS 394.84]